MIAPSQPRRTKRARERERCEGAERELRLCVATKKRGGAELRYFQNPRDAEGLVIRLTAREREELAHALAVPGTHFIRRDDAPEAGQRQISGEQRNGGGPMG